MIKDIVQRLIAKYQTNDPFEIAAQKNILVLYENLGSTLGYFQTSRRIRFIHVNHCLDEGMQRFVCAHELGHACLHPDVNTPFLKNNTFFSVGKVEIEANTFAVELLLQDEDIYSYQDTSLSIQEISAIYGIPKEVSHLKKGFF
ncbi:protein of unknown function [Alteribacillus persepolensis]|uniref:IrrE N-terminal-like domain-containing protein n=1 Tax=Alteribacillus persepolensis TaxID=568899 RepID=A0A1G8IFV7_9BACI|nr:ImmA/IrrE family metallo-endopeptidase [Alteribacillus persepolensis]SDI17763.1 protein of unknown function [Alteribacillus persepolensis]